MAPRSTFDFNPLSSPTGMQTGMSKHDPYFWEIEIDPEVLETLLVEPDFVERLLITSEDEQVNADKEQLKQDALEQIRELIKTRLTPQQRRIIEMYFYENRTQQEIAESLGINQQVVSRHLFGVLRDGHQVGGAVRKLRKLCEKLGMDPQKWV
jgi:RNA polymerase sigma factor (sigma-70 family)